MVFIRGQGESNPLAEYAHLFIFSEEGVPVAEVGYREWREVCRLSRQLAIKALQFVIFEFALLNGVVFYPKEGHLPLQIPAKKS